MTAEKDKTWSTAIRCSYKGKHRHHLFIMKELLLESRQNFLFWVVTRGELQYYCAANKILALHIPMNIWYQQLFLISCLSKCIRSYTFFCSKYLEITPIFWRALLVIFLKNDLFFRTFSGCLLFKNPRDLFFYLLQRNIFYLKMYFILVMNIFCLAGYWIRQFLLRLSVSPRTW